MGARDPALRKGGIAPVTALGYTASEAVSRAENHANPGTENCQLSPCLTNDCAGFVSRSIWWGGGYTQATPRGGVQPTPDLSHQ
jgi:hypothetical protein